MTTLEIITGPAGAGKSAACRERLLARRDVWLVLPTEQQRARWRRELPELQARVKTIHDLARELAGPALGDREVVTPALRLLILRQLIGRQVGPESYFARVADTRGFVRCLADLLSELRQGEIDSGALAGGVRAGAPDGAGAGTPCLLSMNPGCAGLAMGDGGLVDPAFLRKGEEIARLQGGYEEYLERYGLVDAEGLVSLAIERTRAEWEGFSWPSAVMVDGFVEFAPLQLSFFAALAQRVEQMVVTLAHDASRPVLFAHTGVTLSRLCERFPGAKVTELQPPASGVAAAGPALLERQLFRGEAPVKPSDERVMLFEAPDSLMQVEMVAREVRRLLDGGGYRPGEIGVLARSLDGLAPVIRSVFDRYRIPVWLNVGERLGENPFVACVAALLRVWLRDWQREDVLRLLRSSYLGQSRFAVEALERRARRRGLLHGRGRWLALVAEERRGGRGPGAAASDAGGGEVAAELPLGGEPTHLRWVPGRPAPTSDKDLRAVVCRLAEWEDRLRESRSPEGLRDGLIAAVEELGLAAGARRGERELVRADRCAWESALHILDDLARVERLNGECEWTFEAFAAAALAGWEAGFFNRTPEGEERVQALEVYDLSGHGFRAAFVLDLVEGLFPRRPREDPLLRDDEREALARQGVLLPLSMAQADEERLLFYQAVSAPRERLYLCYPRTDGDGRETVRSFFLDELEQAVAPLPAARRSLADVLPGPEEAVLPGERLAYLAAALGDGWRPDSPGGATEAGELCAALRREQPEAVERLLAARDARRAYHLSHAATRGHWRGQRRTYRVTELESARACPFQHYLAYRLGLQAQREGADALDQGNVLHEALRRFFGEVQVSGFPEPEAALARLQALCREIIERTPMDARPYRIRLAEAALLRWLDGFLRREMEYRQASRLEPALLEFAFGPQGARDDEDETGDPEGDAPVDPCSTREPLVIRAGEVEVWLSGKIDRIDRTPEGLALVLDYKRGKAPEKRELQEGKSLQLPVYWLAAEQLLGLQVAGGAYDALRAQARPLYVRSDQVEEAFREKGIVGSNVLAAPAFEQVREQARLLILESVAQIERLEIAPAPADARTCSFCRYQDCCRPEEAGVALDRERGGESSDE